MPAEPHKDQHETLDDDVAALVDGLEADTATDAPDASASGADEPAESKPAIEVKESPADATDAAVVPEATPETDLTAQAVPEGSLSEGPEAVAEPASEGSEEDAEAALSATLAAELGAAAGGSGPAEPPAPRADAGTAASAPSPSEPIAAATSECIESLDAQLAGIADDLLDQEPAQSQDSEPFRPPMPAVAALRPDVYRPRVEPEEPRPGERSQQSEVTPAGEEKPAAIAAPVAEGAAVEWLGQLREPVLNAAHSALASLSAPLGKHPPIVRTTIGIAAAFNLLLAGIVWFYVAFLRPEFAAPPPPVVKAAAKSGKGDDHGKGGDPGAPAKGKAKGKAESKGGGHH